MISLYRITNDICDYVSDASLTISCLRLIDCGRVASQLKELCHRYFAAFLPKLCKTYD